MRIRMVRNTWPQLAHATQNISDISRCSNARRTRCGRASGQRREIAKTPGTLVDINKLIVPTLVLHGTDDPRTEPGELDALQGMPNVEIRMIEGAGHSPHSERPSASICTSIVARFLGVLAMQ